MAFQAKDGKKSTNRAPMMAHNRSLEGMQSKSQAGGAGMEADPLAQPGNGGEVGQDDPHQVMQEHGPAMETHTEHPPEGQEGPHMAHSMHPDGHEHHSQHASGKEAHEHAMCLSGHCDHGSEGKMGEDGEKEPEYD
jgi:hypothetical protein